LGLSPRRRGGLTARGADRSSRSGDAARVALAAIRIFNGALALAGPAIVSRRLASEPDTTAPAHYPFRLFGVRTVVIGIDLLARDRELRDQAVRVALPIHLSDTAAAVIGGVRGELPRRTATMLTALSGTNTLLSLLARRTLR
jgi:hypothetical protein